MTSQTRSLFVLSTVATCVVAAILTCWLTLRHEPSPQGNLADFTTQPEQDLPVTPIVLTPPPPFPASLSSTSPAPQGNPARIKYGFVPGGDGAPARDGVDGWFVRGTALESLMNTFREDPSAKNAYPSLAEAIMLEMDMDGTSVKCTSQPGEPDCAPRTAPCALFAPSSQHEGLTMYLVDLGANPEFVRAREVLDQIPESAQATTLYDQEEKARFLRAMERRLLALKERLGMPAEWHFMGS